jgi:hypothetical protein
MNKFKFGLLTGCTLAAQDLYFPWVIRTNVLDYAGNHEVWITFPPGTAPYISYYEGHITPHFPYGYDVLPDH